VFIDAKGNWFAFWPNKKKNDGFESPIDWLATAQHLLEICRSAACGSEQSESQCPWDIWPEPTQNDAQDSVGAWHGLCDRNENIQPHTLWKHVVAVYSGQCLLSFGWDGENEEAPRCCYVAFLPIEGHSSSFDH